MTDPTYDPRLAARMRTYAQGGVRRIDPIEVAESAFAGTARRRSAGPWLLVAATLLIGGATLAALAIVGAPRTAPVAGSIVLGYEDGLGRSAWRIEPTTSHAIELARLQTATSISPDGATTAWLETGRIHIRDTTTLSETIVPAGGQMLSSSGVLTDGAECVACGSLSFTWSPGGRWVSWTACADASTCRLMVSNKDGSITKVVGPSFKVDDAGRVWLYWSSDERLVLRAPGGFQEGGPDGTNLRPTSSPFPMDSPDGQWISGCSADGINATVSIGGPVAQRSSTGFRGVTGGIDCVWAPDSTLVAVTLGGTTDATSPAGGRLVLLDLDGHQTPVAGIDGAAVGTVRWAPDSSRLFVVTKREPGPEYPDTAAGAIIGRDGRLIARVDGANLGAWSPDGRYLAVSSVVGRPISIVDADGGHARDLTLYPPDVVDTLVWTR